MKQFFEQLNELIGTSDTNMTFRKSEDQITVSVSVKNNTNDSALNQLKPVIVTGTASELDADFFTVIAKPLQKASGLITNVKEFEENLTKAESETKAAKAAKEKAEKDAESKKKAEQKEKEKRDKKFSILIEKAEEFEKNKQTSQAYSAYKQALPFASNPEEIQKKMNSLVSAQASIFDQEKMKSDTTDHLAAVEEEEIEDTEEVEKGEEA